MPMFRKRPVVIEAYEFQNKACEPNDSRPEWLMEAVSGNTVKFRNSTNGPPHLLITTLEGEMTAQIGDWIIRGVNGEIYPCKPEIFAKTYEPATLPLMAEDISDADRAEFEKHTAAANANIDRLNTEIERITRRQQGILAEKGG